MHTLAAKLKDSSFPVVGPQLIHVFIKICNNLPCPECAQHSKLFWSKVKTNNIKNKNDIINLLFVFHNIVNQKKNNKPFKYENLKYYETKNVIETYNTFSKNFNTRGNMNLINESFHRNMMLTSLKTWMMSNINHFDR
jgi:hypothetical protein